MEMVAIPNSQFFRLPSKSKEKHEKIKDTEEMQIKFPETISALIKNAKKLMGLKDL